MAREQTFYTQVLPVLADSALGRAKHITIISGEGEAGTSEDYNGKRTVRALKTRLTKERCGGDRWAFAVIDGYEV